MNRMILAVLLVLAITTCISANDHYCHSQIPDRLKQVCRFKKRDNQVDKDNAGKQTLEEMLERGKIKYF